MQNVAGRTPASKSVDFDYSKLPANPGFAYRLNIRPHPETGELVRGWQRQTHGIMYRSKDGQLMGYRPPEMDENGVTSKGVEEFARFLQTAKSLDPRLVGRPERRKMWREERTRYKRIVKARNRAEASEPEPSFIDGST